MTEASRHVTPCEMCKSENIYCSTHESVVKCTMDLEVVVSFPGHHHHFHCRDCGYEWGIPIEQPSSAA